MLDQATYRATFRKQPETVLLDFKTLKNGNYLVEGTLGQAWWHTLCHELNLAPKGEGKVRLTLDVGQPIMHITGEVETTFERMCVRTLEMFDDTQITHVNEHLTWQQDRADENTLYHEDATLDMGEFIRQQIVLGFDLHPVKDRNHRGGVILSDGFDEGAHTETESPFAVLKQLKKS